MKAYNFLFHRVSPEKDQLWPPMHPFLFEKIIAYIVKRFEIYTIEELVIQKPKSTKKIATISFDDGYKDFLTYALPVLKKYNVKASLYVITDCITHNKPPWTYIIDYTLTNTKITTLIDNEKIPNDVNATCRNFTADRIKFAAALKPYMKKLDNTEREKITTAIQNYYNDVLFPKKLMLSWEELNEIKNSNITIGSHSMTHSMLGNITDRNELFNELKQSYDDIIRHLLIKPITISYPIGSYNESVKKLAKKVGYRIGFAVDFKAYNSKIQDNYEIPRIELYNESFFKCKLRIHNYIGGFKSILRK